MIEARSRRQSGPPSFQSWLRVLKTKSCPTNRKAKQAARRAGGADLPDPKGRIEVGRAAQRVRAGSGVPALPFASR